MADHTTTAPLSSSARTALLAYLGISALVYVLMMLLGLLMRMGQAAWLGIPPNLFYQVMTAHGAGMVGISGLAASAVIWYFLRRYVSLTVGILWANLGFFLLGVVLILGGIFLGGFGADGPSCSRCPQTSSAAGARRAPPVTCSDSCPSAWASCCCTWISRERSSPGTVRSAAAWVGRSCSAAVRRHRRRPRWSPRAWF